MFVLGPANGGVGDFGTNKEDPIQAVTNFMNILVVQTLDTTWGVRGNSGLIEAASPYVPFTINSTVGTIAYKSVRPVRNHLFFLSKQGVIALKSLYAADEQYNIDFVDRNIRNIVPQDSKAVGIQFDNQYWLNFPNFGITLRWYIDKKAWVLDKYGAWDDFNGVFKYQIKDGKLEFITHPSRFPDSGNLHIYKIGVDYSLPTDLFIPILAKFETSFLNQNYPFHPKNYKETKLDFTLQNEYNLGRVALYDSARDGGLDIGDSDGNSSISLTIPSPFVKNHKYRIEFYDTEQVVTHIPLTSILIEGVSGYAGTPTPVGTKTCSLNPETNTTEALCTAAGGTWAVQETLIWEFTISNNYAENANSVDFLTTITNTDFSSIESVTIRDVSYDDSLVFKTWVISEDRTLNIDNYEGYEQATEDVNLDLTLKDRLGDWVFGESDFGNKVTVVKTIKLSGKGYNSKLYLEDLSKSKWTLESLGITYKMKRARSR